MLLDKKDDFVHSDIMEYTIIMFKKYFEDQIVLTKNEWSNCGMGAFFLEYIYQPLKYKINFEHDRLFFSIRIYDQENGFTSLSKVLKNKMIKTNLNKKSIEEAIKVLKEVLENHQVEFYVSLDNKLYKKDNGKLIRVRYPYQKQ